MSDWDAVISLLANQEGLDPELLSFVIARMLSLGLLENNNLPNSLGTGRSSSEEAFLIRSKIVPRLRLYLRYGLDELRLYAQQGLAFLQGRLVDCTLLDYLPANGPGGGAGFYLRVNSIYPAPVFDPGLLASSHSLIVAAFLPESELSPSDLILLNSLKRKSLTSSPPVNLTRTRKRSSTGLLASSLLFAQVIGVGSDRRVISEKGLGGDYLVVSRKGSDFVKNLLALKIPTIASGELEIKNLVREPGYRTIVGVAPPVASGAALVELKAEELAAQCSTVWAAVVAEAGLGLWKERVEIVGWNIYQPERMFSQLFASIGVEFNSLELDHSRRQIRVGLTNTSSQEKDIGKLVGKGGLNLRLIKAFSGWSVVF